MYGTGDNSPVPSTVRFMPRDEASGGEGVLGQHQGRNGRSDSHRGANAVRNRGRFRGRTAASEEKGKMFRLLEREEEQSQDWSCSVKRKSLERVMKIRLAPEVFLRLTRPGIRAECSHRQDQSMIHTGGRL